MSSAVTENDLHQMFAPFGDIIVARIQRGTKQKGLKMCAPSSVAPPLAGLSISHTPKLRFIGFIDFFAVDSAVAAVRALQGVSLCGRPMRLEFSQVQHARPFSLTAVDDFSFGRRRRLPP
jgi:RNA recognition motif-containing protein